MSLDVYLTAVRSVTVYDCNITHNLGRMAEERLASISIYGVQMKSASRLRRN